MNTFNIDEYGEVEVRTAVFDINGTDLMDGIEIKFLDEPEVPIIEIYEYYDLNSLTVDKVEELIENNRL
jgi:hypothetical protein